MPTLQWIGKEKVINHHQDVPYRVLEHTYGFDAGTGKTGTAFDYYTLGNPLFDEDGLLNEDVEESRIREYVWYSETKSPLSRGDSGVCKTDGKSMALYHLLGTKDETAYYFFYQKEAVTTLNHEFLATIKQKAGQYVIYADNCLLPKEFLQSRNIIFKKIPRDITRI